MPNAGGIWRGVQVWWAEAARCCSGLFAWLCTLAIGTMSADFLACLRQSHLLTEADLRSVEKELRDGRALAEELVRRELLTPWQARMLLAGRSAFFLGRYRLIDLLGRGGMGNVFLAEDHTLGRSVAIKVLKEDLLTSSASVARFEREIQAAAAVDHPHVVRAIDADSVGGDGAGRSYFLVMEYVDGPNLHELLKRTGPLPLAAACEIARQTALALAHAHAQGLVHRDVKPSNLLLDWKPPAAPQVKLLDLGLARLAEAAESRGAITATGQVLGTPDYIAPEQAADSRAADARSDIYSLGCTLFFLAARRPPFVKGNVVERMLARQRENAPPLSTVCEAVPTELDAVAARMLKRRPEDRYQGAAEVAAALAPFCPPDPHAAAVLWDEVTRQAGSETLTGTEPTLILRESTLAQSLASSLVDLTGKEDSEYERFLNHLASEVEEGSSGPPTPSTPTSGATRSSRSTRLQRELDEKNRRDRRRWRWVIAGVLAGAAVLIAFALWRQSVQTVLVVEWPLAEREEATLEIDGLILPLPNTQRASYPHHRTRRRLRVTRKGYKPIDRQWDLDRGGSHTFRPRWEPTDETIRHREFATLEARVAAYLQANRGADAFDLEGSHAQMARIEDYRRRWQGSPGVMEAAGRLIARLPVPADALRREDVDADELIIAGQGDAAAAPAELVGILGDSRLRHWNHVGSVGLSPDGRTIASAGGDAGAMLWDAQTGRLLHWFPTGPAMIHGRVAFSPDGSLIATYGLHGVTVWETATKLVRFRFGGNTVSVAYSPDGTMLAAGDYEKSIQLVDAVTGEQRLVLTGHTGVVRSVRFSPDGAALASSADDGTVRLWNVADGTVRHTLRHPEEAGPHGVTCVAFSPDGTLLASASPEVVKLWNPNTGDLRRAIQVHAYHVAFHPDRKTLLTANEAGVWFWDAATGQEVTAIRSVPVAGYSDNNLAFSADGRKLAIGCGDGRVRIFDAQTHKPLIEQPPLLTAAAVSPDGRLLAVGDDEGRVTLHDMATLETIRAWRAGAQKLLKLAFSPSGQTLATAGHVEPVKLWEVSSGELRQTLHPSPGFPPGFNALVFTPDGALLAAIGRHPHVWNVATGRLVHDLKQLDRAGELAVTPDGRTLFAWTGSSPSVLRHFDLATGRTAGAFELEGQVDFRSGRLAFSPDGGLLAVCNYNRLEFWNARTIRVNRSYRSGVKPWQRTALFSFTNDIAYSPDGGTVATAMGNGQVALWQVARKPQSQRAEWDTSLDSPQTALQLGPPAGYVLEVHYTPDGRHLVTVNRNGTVYVLRLTGWSPGE
jgi:WD40 repeat protein/serine/threonine protein kinase